MKKIASLKVYCFDVDNTLVFQDCPFPEFKNADFVLDWHGTKIPMWKHKKHIELIRELYVSSGCVVVWSQQGPEWAEAVVQALGLEDHVSLVMAKPQKMYDDLPVYYWTEVTYEQIENDNRKVI